MNLIIQENQQLIKIIVYSELNKSEIARFIDIIKLDKKCQISLLNIKSLQSEIIKILYLYRKNLIISSNEHLLQYYLMSFGLHVSFQNNNLPQADIDSIEAILIGGSAGSIEKFIKIVKSLPKSNFSIFIVMHQLADKPSLLDKILQTYTKNYVVKEATNDEQIKPSTIYIAPPNKHLVTSGGYIFLSDDEKHNFARPSISISFESFANEYHKKLLAILVCGYGNDGSDSLSSLKENGSTIIIEDPKDCAATMILQSAIKTNIYDYVMNIDEINTYIANLVHQNYLDDIEIKNFLDEIYDVYGYDFRNYHLEHIKRRIDFFYNKLNIRNFNSFKTSILTSKEMFNELFLNISINVTTFFRNPITFKKIKEEILPKLDSYINIKIWCAGCSSGEEAYSLAIFLKELGLLDRVLIYATDMNELILERAKNGLFPKKSYDIFLQHYYQSGGDDSFSDYFNIFDDFVEIKDEIKKHVLFFNHNLATDGVINNFQIIFCRNVLIYFNQNLKNRISDLFKDSLDSYGFLVLGESEMIENQDFTIYDKTNKIFKRKI